MRTRTRVALAIAFSCLMHSRATGRIISPGTYRGVLSVDRWGQKVPHAGPRHLFVSNEAFAKLKDKVGKPLVIDVTKMDQPMNPGAGLIREFSKVEVAESLPGLALALESKKRRIRRGEGLTATFTLRNTSDKAIEFYPT